MRHSITAFCLGSLLCAIPLRAEEIPPPPPMAVEVPPAGSEEELQRAIEEAEQEAAVTIIEKGRTTVQEYRVGGRLVMVKIIPAKGFPYYLVDLDGDGDLETRQNEFDPLPIPQWTIFRW